MHYIKKSVLLYLLIQTNSSFAGAFQMHEQNASLGDVHAGYSVYTKDPSISFYNPAGLVDILTPKATNSAVTVASRMSFKGNTVLEMAYDNPNPPITFSGKTKTNGVHFIPALHYAMPINERFAFGLSIASPFAAELDWSDKGFTRFNSTHNAIKTINFSPSLAYKISNEVSIGMGPEIQYAEMQIDKRIGTSGLLSSEYESAATNTLTSTNVGWHAGILWKPVSNAKLGLSYRSKVIHKATGESKLKGLLAGDKMSLSPDKVNKSKKLEAIIRIPASVALSGEYNPTSDVTLYSTLIYTQWNLVDTFNLKNLTAPFDNGVTPYVYNKLGFKNTYTFLNGINYNYNNKLILKTGIGYDQTPTSNSYRDLKMPDGNRVLFGLGANYDYSKNLNLEFGYMYVKVLKTKINNTSVIPAAADPVMTLNLGEVNKIYGSADGSAHLIGMQFTLNTERVMKYFV